MRCSCRFRDPSWGSCREIQKPRPQGCRREEVPRKVSYGGSYHMCEIWQDTLGGYIKSNTHRYVATRFGRDFKPPLDGAAEAALHRNVGRGVECAARIGISVKHCVEPLAISRRAREPHNNLRTL